jgi:hypothetical protein
MRGGDEQLLLSSIVISKSERLAGTVLVLDDIIHLLSI